MVFTYFHVAASLYFAAPTKILDYPKTFQIPAILKVILVMNWIKFHILSLKSSINLKISSAILFTEGKFS